MVADSGITCPACESSRIKVYESRPGDGVVIRRRKCLACETRFATEERATHIIRMMDSLTTNRGRPEAFPSDGHMRVLKAVASSASNPRQIALVTGISETQCRRLVSRLIQGKMLSAILGSLVEDAHPLTTILDITAQGAALLARSSPPPKCDDENLIR